MRLLLLMLAGLLGWVVLSVLTAAVIAVVLRRTRMRDEPVGGTSADAYPLPALAPRRVKDGRAGLPSARPGPPTAPPG